MGQPIAVVEKPSVTPGVIRFEANRTLTGMGHERYRAAPAVSAHRPVDELARRLFATGRVDQLHVYANVITVDLLKGFDSHGLREVIEGLHLFYTEPDTEPAPAAAEPE